MNEATEAIRTFPELHAPAPRCDGEAATDIAGKTPSLPLAEDLWATLQAPGEGNLDNNASQSVETIDGYIENLLLGAETGSVDDKPPPASKQDSLLFTVSATLTELMYEGLSTCIYLSRQMTHLLFDPPERDSRKSRSKPANGK